MYLLYHLMVQYHPGEQMLVGDGAAGGGGYEAERGGVDPVHIRAHVPEIGNFDPLRASGVSPNRLAGVCGLSFPINDGNTGADSASASSKSIDDERPEKSCRSASATQRSPIEREGGRWGGGGGAQRGARAQPERGERRRRVDARRPTRRAWRGARPASVAPPALSAVTPAGGPDGPRGGGGRGAGRLAGARSHARERRGSGRGRDQGARRRRGTGPAAKQSV